MASSIDRTTGPPASAIHTRQSTTADRRGDGLEHQRREEHGAEQADVVVAGGEGQPGVGDAAGCRHQGGDREELGGRHVLADRGPGPAGRGDPEGEAGAQHRDEPEHPQRLHVVPEELEPRAVEVLHPGEGPRVVVPPAVGQQVEPLVAQVEPATGHHQRGDDPGQGRQARQRADGKRQQGRPVRTGETALGHRHETLGAHRCPVGNRQAEPKDECTGFSPPAQGVAPPRSWILVVAWTT